MGKTIVVGSGPSGVHFALTALKKGHEVMMLDVGHKKPPILEPESDLNTLKKRLDDPVRYLLSPDYDAVIFGDAQSDFYSFPPSKGHVLSGPPNLKLKTFGFEPLVSFARGGLSEV